MSWDIYLTNPGGESFKVKNHNEGGIINLLGGWDEPEMNLPVQYLRIFDFEDLAGKTAAESIPILEETVAVLGTQRSGNFYDQSFGNVGYICNVLLGWAKQFPTGVWHTIGVWRWEKKRVSINRMEIDTKSGKIILEHCHWECSDKHCYPEYRRSQDYNICVPGSANRPNLLQVILLKLNAIENGWKLVGDGSGRIRSPEKFSSFDLLLSSTVTSAIREALS